VLIGVDRRKSPWSSEASASLGLILQDTAPAAELVLVDLPAGESPLEDPKRVDTPRDRPVVVSAASPPEAHGPATSPERSVPLMAVVVVVVTIPAVMVMIVVMIVVVGSLVSRAASLATMTSVTTTRGARDHPHRGQHRA